MKKQKKMVQQFFYPEEDGQECHIVLVDVKDNKVVGISIVPIPDWHKFHDDDYEYYPLCHN